MIRVVLDANVLVSALLNPGGASTEILNAWRDERFNLAMSPAILEEIDRVLRYPKIRARHRWRDAQLRRFIEDLPHLAILNPGN